jgi:uncharacterized membrane protein YvlD (DUF360 family)
MTRYLIRLVLIAGAFYFLLPMIPGVHFNGNFVYALLCGALFAFVGWVVESVAIALTAVLAIATLGLALIVLVPAWLLGFWLLPAVVLKLVADVMPNILVFSGWMPAIWSGLIMLLIGVATSGDVHKKVIRTQETTVVA